MRLALDMTTYELLEACFDGVVRFFDHQAVLASDFVDSLANGVKGAARKMKAVDLEELIGGRAKEAVHMFGHLLNRANR